MGAAKYIFMQIYIVLYLNGATLGKINPFHKSLVFYHSFDGMLRGSLIYKYTISVCMP